MLPPGLRKIGNAVELTAGASVANYAGIGIDATGAMMFSGSNPDFFPNGVPCFNGNGGGLCAIPYVSRALPTNFQSGMLLDTFNRIVTVNSGTAVAPLQQQGGYTFDANGALLTT